MGYDFSYRFNEEEENCKDINISRRNEFLRDIVNEETVFTYQELYETINDALKEIYVNDHHRFEIKEALYVFIEVFYQMDPEDKAIMNYC